MDVSKFDTKKKMEEEKNRRKMEIDQLKKIGGDQVMMAEGIRKENQI